MLDLKDGQKVLDVGGGIGGSAFYMAKVSYNFVYCLLIVIFSKCTLMFDIICTE